MASEPFVRETLCFPHQFRLSSEAIAAACASCKDQVPLACAYADIKSVICVKEA